MSTELLALACVLALAAALRSTWSPCGLSMLSSMTPLSERARGHRYAATAAWFILGAVVGALTLGVATAAGAWVVGRVELSSSTTLALGAVVVLACAAMDAGIAGPPLPHHRRQVNELWFGRYRRWVYASGFGWQIGTGLATYIMTAAVYATVAFASLSADPFVAVAVCLVFGAARGLAVLAGLRITTPARLTAFHRRFDALAQPVRWSVVVVQAAVGAAAAGLALGAWAAGVVIVVAAALLAAKWHASLRSSPERTAELVSSPR